MNILSIIGAVLVALNFAGVSETSWLLITLVFLCSYVLNLSYTYMVIRKQLRAQQELEKVLTDMKKDADNSLGKGD